MATISGGEKLEKALAKITANVTKPATLKVGFLENAKYPNGTSVAMVAAIQEYGAPKVGIPPRPFFRNMIAKKKGEWPATISGLLKANDYDAEKALTIAGHAIAGQLKQSIIDTNSPALSPVTIMLRGMKSHDQSLVVTKRTVGIARARVAAGLTNYGASTKPLIETSNLINSVDSEVKT